jgi:ribose-phosphate pyrophosphokinase
MFARRFASARMMRGLATRNYAKTSSSTRTQMVAAKVMGSNEQTEFSGLFWRFAALTIAGCSLSTSVAYCDDSTPVPAATKMQAPTATTKESYNSAGIKLFTGNANKPLAKEIASHLGMSLGKISVSHFADGEVNVIVNENVRGKDVYIVQPTSPPVNETLMELLLMISTMRRASARKITAIIPYYGYARQDRKLQARVPISAADVARLLEAMGVDRVVAVDLHCGQIQGFFGPRVPVDNLDGGTVAVSYFGDMDLVNPVIVSPDAGGVYRAKQFREALSRKHQVDCSLAMIVKQRAKANEIDRMDLVGSVEGCDAIIVDDMVDTAGTLCKAAEMLKESGARRVFAFCSHGVLSGPAASRIANSVLTELVVLDTILISDAALATGKITQLSVGPLLAQAIYNIHNKKSISALFK